MKKIAVLFSGTGSNLKYILEHLHGKAFEVVVALTNNPEAGGIAFAKEYNIPWKVIDASEFKEREVFDLELVSILEYYKPDITVLAGFMRILTPVFTEQIKAINIHPSLLPLHKGLDAIQRSYEDENETGGVTIHWVNSDLDGGKVILQKEIFKNNLSLAEYDKKICIMEKEALAEAIVEVLKGA
jgi:phosphoribosylglycinamide formyltransferase-1